MAKSLVVYFSATGTTAKAAQSIAKAVQGDLFEIKPQTAYSLADLNWRDEKSRSSLEMKDPSSRPPIQKPLPNLDGYDEIYLGFPIWWGVAPRVVNTFLDEAMPKAKTIHVFVTSGSSGVQEAMDELKKCYSELKFVDGQRVSVW